MSNYFAPAYRVEVNGSPVSTDVAGNIQSLHVVSRPGTLDSFSLTLVNTLPKMRWTHSSDADIFRLGTMVKVLLGYVDDLQEMIEGEITEISPTFPASGVPTVTIQGKTLLHRLQGNTKPRTFNDVTDSEIAQKIAQDANLSWQVEDTVIKHHHIANGNKSDLVFLKHRADLIHFEILTRQKTLLFRKARDIEPKESPYTLVWAQVQKGFTVANTLPLKSFKPTLNVSEVPTHVESRCYDVKSKKAFVSRAGASDQVSRMGRGQAAADVVQNSFQREWQHVYLTTPFESQAEIDQFTRATYNKQAMRLVGGSGDTIGIPRLRAGQIVKLEGLGAFEGDYRIEEATHALDNSGYHTSFTVNRNTANTNAKS